MMGCEAYFHINGSVGINLLPGHVSALSGCESVQVESCWRWVKGEQPIGTRLSFCSGGKFIYCCAGGGCSLYPIASHLRPIKGPMRMCPVRCCVIMMCFWKLIEEERSPLKS